MDDIRAQVFQNAVCNWRCWYCFVPFNLLSANHKHAEWLTPSELVDLYLEQTERPTVIDLTGGQPDLTPEWVPWMIQEIRARGLEDTVYLWSDDNLSTDYFWRYLSTNDIDLVRNAKNYGRVCCFKGFDEASFSFNTLADEALFQRQFDLFRRFVDIGIDLYAYVTLTSPTSDRIVDRIRRFVDRLQTVHENLPLRTVPLEIQVFAPVHSRVKQEQRKALKVQQMAVEAWCRETRRPVLLGRADSTDHRCAADGVSAMVVSTSTYQPMTIYQRDIDQWIIGAYRAGAQDFWRLVSMLPAVYPTVVRQAVERLIAACRSSLRILPSRGRRGIQAVYQGRRFLACQPPTHLPPIGVTPRGTAGELLERVITSTDPTQTVALLGSPSVHKMAAIREAPRQFILLDQNGSLSHR